MRLISCKYCGRVHPSTFDCGKKPVHKRGKESTDITKLRTCRRWANTREAAYERDHYMCRVCAAQKRITTEHLEAHHIVPLAEDADLAYELDNIITLCPMHHKAADAGRINRAVLREMVDE